MRKHATFPRRVLAVVSRIPRGRVATYGQIAALCGSPRAARQVGWMLAQSESVRERERERERDTSGVLPWWRVVNRTGRVSIIHPAIRPADQARLLRREGVRVRKRAGSYWVDLKNYLWKSDDSRQ